MVDPRSTEKVDSPLGCIGVIALVLGVFFILFLIGQRYMEMDARLRRLEEHRGIKYNGECWKLFDTPQCPPATEVKP